MNTDILTSEQLVMKGWSRSQLLAEIHAGRLRARLDGAGGFSVSVGDFNQWHANDADQQISNGIPGAARQHQHHVAAAGSTGEQWQELCGRLVQEGTPAHIARAAADRAFPTGRQALVEQTNRAATEQRIRDMTETSAARVARQTRR